jgi:CTP synthase
MPLNEGTKEKLAMFCHVPSSQILSAHNVTNVYHVPKMLEEQGATKTFAEKLGLKIPENRPNYDAWCQMLEKMDSAKETVNIAVVAKYTGTSDTYLSVVKAMEHAAFSVGSKLKITWIDASDLETEDNREEYYKAWTKVKTSDGILIPGGFGVRGTEGKIAAVKYARENKVPFLGVCLGLQVAVIEYARSILGLEDANSTEFDPKTTNPAIIFMPEGSRTTMGGTMRLGSR